MLTFETHTDCSFTYPFNDIWAKLALHLNHCFLRHISKSNTAGYCFFNSNIDLVVPLPCTL